MSENSKYTVLSLSFASYTSIFLALIPVIYVSNGFTTKEIAFLSSIYTFGAIIQPLFSIMTDKIGIKKTLMVNFMVLIISSIILFLSENFLIYVIFITLYYVFQAPNIGLVDNFLKLISEQRNIKFGKLRAFVSAGWGLGTILAIPFLYYFSEKSILVLIIALILITILAIFSVQIKETQETCKKKIKLDIFRNRQYRKVLLISTLIMGVWGIKSSYQTLLILSKTSSVYVVSIISVISIIMELLIIPHVERLYHKYSYKKLILVASAAGALLTFGYYYFDTVIIIIALASLHGVLCGIMIPLNVFKVREIVAPGDFDSAMLSMYSIQNLFSFILITLLINRIYVLINIGAVYLFLSMILVFVIILNSRLDYS